VELGKESLGTTKKGIGPTFASKAARTGITIAEMFDAERFQTRLRLMAAGYQKRYGELLKYDVEEEIARFKTYTETLAPFVIDEIPLLRSAKREKLNVVLEGAQASMLVGGVFVVL
jgi:adenylosuccinate synthase